jgi:3-dehydro-L-gulonate-6-phosphate decarboxylase
VQRVANWWKRRAEVDMTGVADPLARAKELIPRGVSLVLYHRSMDEEQTAGALWDDQACQTVRELCDLGLDVVVAGGVDLDMLAMLCEAPLYAIVVGRGITAQADPAHAARRIHARVRQVWPG